MVFNYRGYLTCSKSDHEPVFISGKRTRLLETTENDIRFFGVRAHSWSGIGKRLHKLLPRNCNKVKIDFTTANTNLLSRIATKARNDTNAGRGNCSKQTRFMHGCILARDRARYAYAEKNEWKSNRKRMKINANMVKCHIATVFSKTFLQLADHIFRNDIRALAYSESSAKCAGLLTEVYLNGRMVAVRTSDEMSKYPHNIFQLNRSRKRTE